MQAVEPAAGLVNRLADIVRRETPVLKQGLVLKGVMALGYGMAPESNQQSITSGTRFIFPPHLGQSKVTSSTKGRCKSSGSLKPEKPFFPFSSSKLPTHSRSPQDSQRQTGSGVPQ